MDRATAETQSAKTENPEATRVVTLTVNGVPHSVETTTRTTLAIFLREDLRLTGTHIGCAHGVCGACTVMMDGQSIRSCHSILFSSENEGVHRIAYKQYTGIDPGGCRAKCCGAQQRLSPNPFDLGLNFD
jgi:hypothetical protein